VDNAIEAGATRVDVCFERPKHLKAHQCADSISAIAFIDNGSGMLPKMAQYALSWGSGTHDLPFRVEVWDARDAHVEELVALAGGDHAVARSRRG
jgi:hypothetical protein